MELATHEQDGVTVAAVTGDVNAATSGALAAALSALVAQGCTRLVLDLSAVPYVSSAGLRVFLIVAKQLQGRGVLVLASPVETVRQVLDVTGFSRIITVRADVTAAVSAAQA